MIEIWVIFFFFFGEDFILHVNLSISSYPSISCTNLRNFWSRILSSPLRKRRTSGSAVNKKQLQLALLYAFIFMTGQSRTSTVIITEDREQQVRAGER